jgi:hypothetical protein
MTTEDVLAPPSAVEQPTPDAGRVRRRPPWQDGSVRTVGVLLVLLLAASAFVVHTTAGLIRNQPPATYAVAGPHQTWLRASSPGTTAWFRHEVPLRARPVAASVTVDGTDDVMAWVNGHRDVLRTTDPHDVAEIGMTADIAPDLRTGANTVLIQVTDVSRAAPRLWGTISLAFDDGTRQVIGPASAGWQATTDPAAVGVRLGALPTAARSSAGSATSWPGAVSTSAPRAVLAAVPPQVVALPHGRTAASAADAGVTFSARTGAATSDAWLRISASARASVTLDGRLITELAAPGYMSPRGSQPGWLTLVHLGRLPAGSSVGVRLGRSARPAVYADLVVPRDGSWVVRQLPAAGLSAVDSSGTASAVTAVDVTAVWPNGWRVAQQTVPPAPADALGKQLLAAGAAALLLVAMALVAARLRGTGPRRALTLALAGSLPGIAACAAYLAWQRWTGHLPGTGRSGWAVAIASLWFVGVGVAELGLPRVAIRARWLRAVITPPPLVYATAVAGGLWVLSGIGRSPLWQDEATSLQVARDINAHGVPRLASDLIYFKAELYHVLLAALLHVSDNVLFLRSVSDLWFVGSVIVFGRLLMPVLAPGRPWLHAAAAVAFTLLPAERVWADQLRMYQQMQFFSILFLALLLRSLRTGRPRDIRWAAVLLVLTYLSHEESFVLLPGVGVLLLVRWRAVASAGRSFALAFVPAALVIAAQYVLAQAHPPVFGTDLSNRPYVGLDLDRADYYYNTVFFAPIGTGASLAVVSTLAVVAVVTAARRRDRTVTGAGIVLLASTVTASMLFTAKDPRYAFVLLPCLVALAVLGAVAVWSVVARSLRRGTGFGGLVRGRAGLRRGVIAVGAATVALLCVATAATTVMSGAQFTRPASFHPDYTGTVGYLVAHRPPGDVTITLSPPVMTAQYAGVAPDRVVQTGANKLLYVTLKNGRAVDTVLGVPVLLTGDDVRRYVAAHPRVWLVSDDGGYLADVPADVRTAIISEFHVVYESGSTTLSVAGYAT